MSGTAPQYGRGLLDSSPDISNGIAFRKAVDLSTDGDPKL